MIMTSLDWIEGWPDSQTPGENSRPTPLKHLQPDIGDAPGSRALQLDTMTFANWFKLYAQGALMALSASYGSSAFIIPGEDDRGRGEKVACRVGWEVARPSPLPKPYEG